MKQTQPLTILAWLSVVCLCALPGAHGGQSLSVIPQPVSLEEAEGAFKITHTTTVVASRSAKAEAGKLIEQFALAMGFRLKLAQGGMDRNVIALSLDFALRAELGAEGYKLDVTTKRIKICAAKSAGLFYGIQTLRQLLPVEIFSPVKVEGVQWSTPCVKITDYPRFSWRGLLIDPARHFIPKEDMYRFIDAMVIHKFNRLQVHFTDDQGWRLEIKKHPKLTEIGSKMDRSRHRDDQGKYVGGFYCKK